MPKGAHFTYKLVITPPQYNIKIYHYSWTNYFKIFQYILMLLKVVNKRYQLLRIQFNPNLN